MFIAMNRFMIALGFEDGFEKVWRERDSYLSEVQGFVSFALLKGATNEDHALLRSSALRRRRPGGSSRSGAARAWARWWRRQQ